MAVPISSKIMGLAEQRICVNGVERLGQAVYNAAMELCPEETIKLKGTKYDPFYDDDRIKIFLNKIQEANKKVQTEGL